MIQVESLTIAEFRGIRSLSLNLQRRNFAVCGSNGTGKSGVVDALEFVLTGTISRLTGKAAATCPSRIMALTSIGRRNRRRRSSKQQCGSRRSGDPSRFGDR